MGLFNHICDAILAWISILIGADRGRRQKMPDLPPEMQVRFLTYILESSSHVADQSGGPPLF